MNFLKIQDDVPRVQVSPKQVYVNLNESLILNCKLMSNPLTAIVQWTKNDVKLKDSNRTRMLVSFLIYLLKYLNETKGIFKDNFSIFRLSVVIGNNKSNVILKVTKINFKFYFNFLLVLSKIF